MRIACVYLPSFALQAHVRQSPFLAGRSFAIARGGTLKNVFVCSKAAWDFGVRPGMTPAAARKRAPHIELLPANSDLYQEALEALGESFLHLSLTVDIGNQNDIANDTWESHPCIYVKVPKNCRGDSFAQKLLAQLERQGYRGRIGIADNRFTAWVAAQQTRKAKSSRNQPQLFKEEFRTIPTGGNAAFLAPLSIDLLGLDSNVQQMLETLGIATLGNFATLPPPTNGTRWTRDGIDFRNLAQGEGPTFLYGFAPTRSVVERMNFESALTDMQAMTFCLRPLADRTCDRMQGRSMAVSSLVLRLHSPDGKYSDIEVSPVEPTLHGSLLFQILLFALQDSVVSHPVVGIQLLVTEECEPAEQEATLVKSQGEKPSNTSIDMAITKLESIAVAEKRSQQSFRLTGWAGAPLPQRKASERCSAKRRKVQGDSEYIQPLQVLLPLA